MKPSQYSRKQPCYYCGAPPPSGREHAPPAMMFQGFRCSSITVPACSQHNTVKAIGDRAVVTALLMSASQMHKHSDKISAPLTPNVIKAVELAEPSFNQAKKEVELRKPLVDPPEGLDIEVPYTQAEANVRKWIRQLAAAIVWSAIGHHVPEISWDETPAWSPGYVESDAPLTAAQAVTKLNSHERVVQEFNTFPWKTGWSAHPTPYPSDIYRFDLAHLQNPELWQNNNFAMRHWFYNGTSQWYSMFAAPAPVAARLDDFIGG